MPPDRASEPRGAPDEGAPPVAVLLPLPLAGAYDYAVPAGLTVGPGDYVVVPLGGARHVGVVWGAAEGAVEARRLRPIERRFDAPPMPEEHRRFVERVAAYTVSLPGAVLRLALGATAALDPAPPTLLHRRSALPVPAGLRLTPARRQVLAVLEGGPARPLAEIAREAGVGAAVVRGLADAGLVEAVPVPGDRPPPVPDWSRPGPVLSAEQAAAAADLAARVRERRPGTVLLDGVTGSGKTEVYFEAIAACLKAGRQALVLVPEIALTGQWLGRFERRFGVPPVEWHSEVSSGDRRRAWRAIATGTARVVVGARSALFLPYPDLGLIVVDEEHDGAFKQEDGVVYHGRDMAVLRGHLAGFPVVLASATPSLETVVNVEAGRYGMLHLPDRHGGASLPEIRMIDLRSDRPERQRWMAPTLVRAVGETLAAGEQALLFLNRRGYAPLTLCRACGHRLECPSCTAWLVEHRLAGRLQCHHCGFTTPLPRQCPACGETDTLAACGPGVERLAEEVAARFPAARVELVASDTLTGPRAVEALVGRVARHEVDILIGTQVVAKGHHFPMLTLVGVIDADLGLHGGDLRAGERTFQLLSQVAGRAGRAERPGVVYLQTLDPGHPVMQALAKGDRDGFLAAEAEGRRQARMPPFARLAALILSSPSVPDVDRAATMLARTAPAEPDLQVLGPAPAPLAVLRGRHRRRFLVNAPRQAPLQAILRDWLGRVRLPGSVRCQVDVDPYGFL
ncbi:primosomal protein N' [Stella sp.]|uniref:primosomal protein N' n=1 Tax=Stella sp. TaxID=2912054 RepID=UPI0035AEA242